MINRRYFKLPIELGGTGSASGEELSTSIGTVHMTEVNVPGGVLGLNSQGVIDPQFNSQYSYNLIGPATIALNSPNNEYIIDDYDTYTTYTVSCSHGSPSVSGNIVTVGISTTNLAGIHTLTINGKNYNIEVV